LSHSSDSPIDAAMRLVDIATRHVLQLHREEPLSRAIAIMEESAISSIVVTTEDGPPCGIITEQNILAAMQQDLSTDMAVAEVMSAPIITVPMDMDSREAYLLCLREEIRHLVLVDDTGRVAGVISETDFRRHLNLTALAGRRHAASVMSRAVLSLPPETPLTHALELMKQGQEDCLIVVDDHHRPAGIITERDVVRLFRRDAGVRHLPLREVMSSPVITTALSMPLNAVAKSMLEANLRHIVVVDDNGALAGMISEHDLTQVMAFGLVDHQAQTDRIFLRTLLDSVPDLIWMKDPNGVFLACNAHFEQLLDASEKEILGRTDFDFVPHELAEFFRQKDIEAMNAGGPVRNEELITLRRTGYRGHFDTIKTPVRDRSGRLIGVLGVARNITERKEMEHALEESTALLNAVVDSTNNLIWSVNVDDFSVLTFNKGLQDFIKRSFNVTLRQGMQLDEVLPTQELVERWSRFYKRALNEGSYSTEYTSERGNAVLHMTFNPLYRNGKVFGISTFAEDITERKRSEEQIEYLAYHDTLTDLPNRALAEQRFELSKSYADRNQARLALLLLDIDNFKSINDALGHRVGDRLLKTIAERLRNCVRSADTVCRLGGDDFLVMLGDLDELENVATFANKLIQVLPEPVEIEGHSLSVTASIGIAIYPDNADSMEELMRMADSALFVVKDAGRNDFRFSDEQFNAETLENLTMRNELRLAVERNELVLHYQPQIDLYNGRLVGVEALLRWNSPTRGQVSPATFIPIAEESGLILPIGEWVLNEACRQAAEWQRNGIGDDLTMAVNLSAVQFQRGNLEEAVLSALESSGLDPQLLELELTESILVRDPEQVFGIVQRLKQLGISLSIDDFGTGYSSLSYLQRFPVDKLKIDQSFVRDMASDAGDAELVRAIIQMARALELQTIAEGIEDETTAKHLRIHHCEMGQGFYFSHPLPAEELEAFAGKAPT